MRSFLRKISNVLYFADDINHEYDEMVMDWIPEDCSITVCHPNLTPEGINEANLIYLDPDASYDLIIGAKSGAIAAMLITDSLPKILIDPKPKEDYPELKELFSEIDLELKAGMFTIISPNTQFNPYDDRREYIGKDSEWFQKGIEAADSYYYALSEDLRKLNEQDNLYIGF